MFDYGELHAHSGYSFLDGVCTPYELVSAAAEAGYQSLAITDHNGLYAAIQQYKAASELNIGAVYGVEFTLEDSSHLPVLAASPAGYQEISRVITAHNLSAESKTEPKYNISELSGDWFVLTGTKNGPVGQFLHPSKRYSPLQAERALEKIISHFGRDRVGIELNLCGFPGDRKYAQVLETFSHKYDLPLVATGALRQATARQTPLTDLITAARLKQTLEQCEAQLPARRTFVRSKAQLLRLYEGYESSLHNAGSLGRELAFDFSAVAPSLPRLQHPGGVTDSDFLRTETARGAKLRYGTKADNPTAWKMIEKELKIIEQLGFCGYFLIVYDIVKWCKKQGILCQGRGSAANSAVCYALGITAVDAVKHKMLFERFLSPERTEYPDIDLDIESQRREEVIQYVYSTYGRENAAQVANIITLKPRSAVRLVSRALGYTEPQIRDFAKEIKHQKNWPEKLPKLVSKLSQQILNLPRHIGIHSGGMVLTSRPIADLVPVQWAAMEGRSVVQWDKDDCADAGLVKFDLLGLGMLTALRLAFSGLAQVGIMGEDGNPIDLHSINQDDAAVYDLLCAGDTVGVFQVESRAQMNMLPRLQPRCFYDVVIEVALVRPGPIQAQTVNPYLRRRQGLEEVSYLHEASRPILEKTLGVPLFQEQLMRLAVEVAGFTPREADELRRAMGSKRGREKALKLLDKLKSGMRAAKMSPSQVSEMAAQFEGFSHFGFPESHAFSFAYIVYASAWLKVHYPAFFYAAILNSQPMGFYSPATLVADARRHHVQVEAVDVQSSDLCATPSLPSTSSNRGTIRLGLETIKGIGRAASRVVKARETEGRFKSVEDLAIRAQLSVSDLEKLALAGALESLGVSRRQGIWEAGALGTQGFSGNFYQAILPGTAAGAYAPELAEFSEFEILQADLLSTNLSRSSHPLNFHRDSLNSQGIITATQLSGVESGTRIKVAGIVTHRQRPSTARGVTFLALEDETGLMNILCSPGFWQNNATVLQHSSALVIRGICDRYGKACTIVADGVQALPITSPVVSRDYC